MAELPLSAQSPQTRACPYCGEQILKTAIKCKHCLEFLDGSNRQAPSSTPKKSALPGENVIWKGAPSYLYYLGHFFAGAGLLAMVGLGLILTEANSASPNVMFVFLGLLGISLIFIGVALINRNTKTYTLTNKSVISKVGIIARQVHEVGVKDIRSINVNQSILERIFSIGTVEIGSAGTAGIEVQFTGVKHPLHVRDLIRNQKNEAEGND